VFFTEKQKAVDIVPVFCRYNVLIFMHRSGAEISNYLLMIQEIFLNPEQKP